MSIGVIEVRPKMCYDDTQWYPAVVGNMVRPNVVRYAADYDTKKGTVEMKSLTFLKNGEASNSDRNTDQLFYSNYSPFLHRHARAVGAKSSNARSVDTDDLRLITFETVDLLNAYLGKFKIKTVAVPAVPAAPEVALQTGEQTVQELYQELAKVMASNPTLATAKVVKCKAAVVLPAIDGITLGKQNLNISRSLLSNAVDTITERLQAQAENELNQIYRELSPGRKVPKIKVSIAPVKVTDEACSK